ncbi:uncharacterized protein LOC119111681 [Pollicipes pollicipes]|uniref:uncharacterized protein LOC119111681 n=1 Tax=Pollicipes pollicipes TaxID=41117 RepID=UPI0018856C31|nr:uncharacterized protein LOC119111681 [Pollicipes pollicipes]
MEMDSFGHAQNLAPAPKIPGSVRLCGRYMRTLPWICVPLIVIGISIFILCHHYSSLVPDGGVLASLQTAGPLILALTVLLLALGIAGSCHIGTYLSARREASVDGLTALAGDKGGAAAGAGHEHGAPLVGSAGDKNGAAAGAGHEHGASLVGSD